MSEKSRSWPLLAKTNSAPSVFQIVRGETRVSLPRILGLVILPSCERWVPVSWSVICDLGKCILCGWQLTWSGSLGTFARVWLARLSGDERKDRVYALKILRKADGMKSSFDDLLLLPDIANEVSATVQ